MKLYAVSNTKGRGLVDAVFSSKENAEEWLDWLYSTCSKGVKIPGYRITYTNLDSPGDMYDLGIYKRKKAAS